MKYTRNQKTFLLAGGAWSAYSSLTTFLIVAFALAIGASNTVVGFIGAMPPLALFIAAMPGVLLAQRFARKKVCYSSYLVSSIGWLAVVLLPLLFFKENPYIWLVMFFLAIKTLELVADPSLTTLLADAVPTEKRGIFFAKRSQIIGITGLIVTLLSGIYLDMFPKTSLLGFMTLFLLGIYFGVVQALLYKTAREPTDSRENIRFRELLNIPKQYRQFLLFSFFFQFAVMIASPFFAVYLLKDLGLSYTLFTALNALSVLARILVQPALGRLTDIYGDRPIALLSFFGTAIVPLWFVFITKTNLWLLYPAHIFLGVAWAGADLCLFNLLLDVTQKRHRAHQVAEYQMLVAIPMIVGPIVGGIIADKAVFFLKGIPLLFMVATVLRAAAACAVLKLKETRIKKQYPLSFVVKEYIGQTREEFVKHRFFIRQ